LIVDVVSEDSNLR